MGNFFNKRTEANLQARYTFSEHWNLLSGARFMEDYSQYYEPSSPFVFSLSGKNDIRFTTISVFLQSENRYRNFLLTSGLRYEKHSQFGAVLVPRLNLTGSLSEWSFDLQYNEAFRAPSIVNMDLNPSIKPERTIDYEAELNRMLGKKTRFSLVLYHMQVMNPIVYTFQNGSENYFNDVKLGTAGLETEFHYRDQHTEIRASYSFYYSVFSSPLFAVEDRSMSNIAMPNHKVNIMARRFFGKHFYLSAQALTFSSVFGYDFTDDLIEQRPMALVSVSSGFRNIANHWDVSVSVNDLLNEQFNYFQAYRSGNDPLPGAGRAWHLKLIYRLPFGQGR
jgi:outer membrane cobalamin receptor